MSSSYILKFTEDALDDLAHLDKEVASRILVKLEWLVVNAESIQHRPLTGRWSGYYRLRVGDYRVIYQLDRAGQLVVVEVVGHRRTEEIVAESMRQNPSLMQSDTMKKARL